MSIDHMHVFPLLCIHNVHTLLYVLFVNNVEYTETELTLDIIQGNKKIMPQSS